LDCLARRQGRRAGRPVLRAADDVRIRALEPGRRDAKTNAATDIVVRERQIGAFDDCCRTYAPRYRQASTRAFGAMAADGGKAYALAYSDVRAAFRRYMAHENKERPFLLVGHSQGALHILKLLVDEIDDTPRAKQLIAVYAPGIGVPMGDFGIRFRTIVPCDTPQRTVCIASWNSFLPGAETHAYLARATAAYVAEHGAKGADLLCTNPLTFDLVRPSGKTEANLGGIVATTGAARVPHAASAVCDGGVLRVSATATLIPLPGGSLHFYDIPLFWENLRANAAVRIRAFSRR
jgi:hypothetical protein